MMFSPLERELWPVKIFLASRLKGFEDRPILAFIMNLRQWEGSQDNVSSPHPVSLKSPAFRSSSLLPPFSCTSSPRSLSYAFTAVSHPKGRLRGAFKWELWMDFKSPVSGQFIFPYILFLRHAYPLSPMEQKGFIFFFYKGNLPPIFQLFPVICHRLIDLTKANVTQFLFRAWGKRL